MRLPPKIPAFGGVSRYDEPQKGRYRYFHQWDVEIYGKPNLESEAEIIELTSRLFDSLLLKDITIDINHRNLVESFINQTFDSKDPKLVSDMLRAIDKIQKKSNEPPEKNCGFWGIIRKGGATKGTIPLLSPVGYRDLRKAKSRIRS